MDEISVVIITRNRLEKLKRCIESVRTKFSAAEIVIIDNGSTDGTTEYVNRLPFKIISNQSNQGVAAARNIGIRASTRQFVMFLDDDAWIDSFEYAPMAEYFKKNSQVGIIAPKLLYPNGQVQESIRSFPTIQALLLRGSGLDFLTSHLPAYRKYIEHDVSSIHETDWAIGACQIIRKDVFAKAGLLDEHYFFGYEDADLCRRARAYGYTTVYWPHGTIFHDYARSSSRGINRHLFEHVSSIVRFFRVSKKPQISTS